MNKMKSFLAAIATGLFLCAPQAAEAAAPQTSEPPVLMVDGTTRPIEDGAEATPDCATISVGVVTQAADAKTAQEENAKKAQAVQRALVAAGIPEANIQTRGYYFQPLYERETRENEITGYRAENNVTVRIDDLADVSRVINLALKNGANSISSLDFGVKNADKVRKIALTAAVNDARKKADELAAALGRRVVGLKAVSENTYPFAERSAGAKMLMAADAAPTPIAPGMLEMSAEVHIEYYLSE